MEDIGPKIAAGRTAEVFLYGPGRVLKLFREDWGQALAQIEFENTRHANQLGLRAPKVFEISTFNGRPGIVFEFAEGETLTSLILKEPWKMVWGGRLLARLHAGIHDNRSDLFPPLKIGLERRLVEYPNIEPWAKTQALEMLRTAPDDNVICHGDFHPDNVLVCDESIVIIDWPTALSGSGIYDFARTALLLKIGMPEETRLPRRMAIRVFQAWLARIYVAAYQSTVTITRDDFARWTFIAAAVRLAEGIPAEREFLMATMAKSDCVESWKKTKLR